MKPVILVPVACACAFACVALVAYLTPEPSLRVILVVPDSFTGLIKVGQGRGSAEPVVFKGGIVGFVQPSGEVFFGKTDVFHVWCAYEVRTASGLALAKGSRFSLGKCYFSMPKSPLNGIIYIGETVNAAKLGFRDSEF